MDNSSNRPLAVVTGAASGIGYELAKQFAQNGFDLLVTATGASLDEAAQTFQQWGASVETIQADLATYDGIEQLYARIVKNGQPVEAIAIDAGVDLGTNTTTVVQSELQTIDRNVAAVHLAKRVKQDMVGRGRGKILFCSAIVSQLPSHFQAVYAMSKAFVDSFAEVLRQDLQDTGVTVTALLPDPTAIGNCCALLPNDPAAVAKLEFDALMSA